MWRSHGDPLFMRAYLQRNISSMGKNKNKLSKELTYKMRYFIQDTSLARVSQNLRTVFFDYLRNQREGLPAEFDGILNDMEALFELLDVAAEERNLK